MDLVINAPNVHQGGGMSLLNALLGSLDHNFQGCIVLDNRMKIPDSLPDSIKVHRIRPTIFGRLIGECRMRKMVDFNTVVLCFGNLPPLFKLKAKVFIFIQNRYQIDQRSLKGFPVFSRVKFVFERLWFNWGKRHIHQYIVQTPSMQHAIQEKLGKTSRVLPFSENPDGYNRTAESLHYGQKVEYDFIYVASGETHKNHKNLIKAWSLLAKEEIRPSLCLTLEEKKFVVLCAWIEHEKKKFDLKIVNAGNVSNKSIESLYRKTRALIYPSDFESLGLPLIEARCAGLPILAPELDYVRDVIDPEQTFDPNSPVSIARAVKRFLGKPERPLPLTDAKTFLTEIMNKVE